MKLIIMRHGATRSNELGLINGQSTEPVTKQGQAQILELVKRLHDKPLELIYSSTLPRAIQTAEPIALDHNLVVHEDVRLVEVNFGSLVQQPYAATIPLFGKNSSDLLSTYDYDLSQLGGETAVQVRARVDSFLVDLKKQTAQTTLVVTHGGIIRWLSFLVTGQKMEPLSNLGLRELDLTTGQVVT